MPTEIKPKRDHWFKFWPEDWENDMKYHPLEIGGLWLRIICLIFLYGEGGTYTTNVQFLKQALDWKDDEPGYYVPGITKLYTDFKAFEVFRSRFGKKTVKFCKMVWYLFDKKIADGFFHDDGRTITITSRRMVRDLHERELARLRKQKERSKCHEDVTKMSHPESRREARSYKKPLSEFPKEQKSRSKYSREDQDNRLVLEEYIHEAYRREWGCPYPLDFGKDRKIMYRLVKKIRINELLQMVEELIQLVKNPREEWFKAFSLEVLEKYKHRLLQEARRKIKKDEEAYGPRD